LCTTKKVARRENININSATGRCKNTIFVRCLRYSGHRSWLQIQRSRFRFLAPPDVLRRNWSEAGFTQPREYSWGPKTPWSESASELYQPNDTRLSAKCQLLWIEGCSVASETDPYGRNLGFLDRSRYFFFQLAPELYSREGNSISGRRRNLNKVQHLSSCPEVHLKVNYLEGTFGRNSLHDYVTWGSGYFARREKALQFKGMHLLNYREESGRVATGTRVELKWRRQWNFGIRKISLLALPE
jgi:hypothetical protein